MHTVEFFSSIALANVQYSYSTVAAAKREENRTKQGGEKKYNPKIEISATYHFHVRNFVIMHIHSYVYISRCICYYCYFIFIIVYAVVRE